MNGLRKQLDEDRNLNGASGFNNQITTVGRSTTRQTATDFPVLRPTVSMGAEDADAEEINEPETLNLSDLGRQMVEKALERNGGNRKKAAQELGISDRTLYRRIKQYGLESNK